MRRTYPLLTAILAFGIASAQGDKPDPDFPDPRKTEKAEPAAKKKPKEEPKKKAPTPAKAEDKPQKAKGDTNKKKPAPKKKAAPKTVAVYDLSGPLTESGSMEADPFSLLLGGGGDLFSGERPLTMFDIVRSMKQAAKDPQVAAVVLHLDEAFLGTAQIQEIRHLVGKIVAAKKPVHVYTQNLSDGVALCTSTSDHLVLLPEGGVGMDGIYSESMYMKDLFDRYGVEIDVVHIGDFKAAGETYSRSGPSEQAKQQDGQLMDDMFQQLVNGVAKGRDIEGGEVRRVINQGFTTPEEALEIGLVDELAYKTDFIRDIRKRYPKAKFDRGYELPDVNGPEINGMMDLMKLAFSSGDSAAAKEDYLAVVVLEGAIMDGSIAPVRKHILKLAKDPKAKGLLFRINSPGGSALASDVLWEATEEFKATGKPFVVSMGNVAASGGYYVAAGADRIFAEPGTITGSIGVVGMKMAYGAALERFGVRFHSDKRGRYADLFSPSRGLSAAEEKLLRRSMLDVYATFKQRVRDGRGEVLTEELESIAGGRVYSGKRAKELGLVDQLGGLGAALDYLSKKADVPADKARLVPEPAGALDGLFGPPPSSGGDDGEFIEGPKPKSSPLQALARESGLLRALDPSQRQAFLEAITLLQGTGESGRPNILMIAPGTSTSVR